MPNIIQLLTVDDHEANIKLIQRGLRDGYDVDTADCGEVALQKLSESNYDIILLDVDMPGLNGYEVCTALRKSSRNADVPVIFISALTELDDKLKGYAAGGNDYIDKPVLFDELKQKIDLTVNYHRDMDDLGQQLKFATETAMTAMSNSNELGIIVNFIESTFQNDDVSALLETLVNSLSQYQVSSCIQIRQNGNVINGCSAGIQISHLECDLLSRGEYADRIITLDHRGFFNTKRVSILIRDLPIEDEGKYGRLVDHIAAIVVAADVRCKQIELQEQKLGMRDTALGSVANIADEEIDNMQQQFGQFREEANRIMTEMHADIEVTLLDIKLTNNQEDYLYRLLGQAKAEMSDLMDMGSVFEDSLAKIKSIVANAIKNMA